MVPHGCWTLVSFSRTRNRPALLSNLPVARARCPPHPFQRRRFTVRMVPAVAGVPFRWNVHRRGLWRYLLTRPLPSDPVMHTTRTPWCTALACGTGIRQAATTMTMQRIPRRAEPMWPSIIFTKGRRMGLLRGRVSCWRNPDGPPLGPHGSPAERLTLVLPQVQRSASPPIHGRRSSRILLSEHSQPVKPPPESMAGVTPSDLPAAREAE